MYQTRQRACLVGVLFHVSSACCWHILFGGNQCVWSGIQLAYKYCCLLLSPLFLGHSPTHLRRRIRKSFVIAFFFLFGCGALQ